MSEFNLGRDPNEKEEYYNISANYVFNITELDDTKYFYHLLKHMLF